MVVAAQREGLDPRLLVPVIHVESRFNHSSVSWAGAMGFGQLMPGRRPRPASTRAIRGGTCPVRPRYCAGTISRSRAGRLRPPRTTRDQVRCDATTECLPLPRPRGTYKSVLRSTRSFVATPERCRFSPFLQSSHEFRSEPRFRMIDFPGTIAAHLARSLTGSLRIFSEESRMP